MKSKLIFAMALVLILLSFSSVYAGDADNQTIQATDQITSDNGVIKENTEVTDVAFENEGSFSELQNLINKSNVVNLTKDYTASESDKRILITGDLTIHGNGHYINGNNITQIFEITGGNIVLNNVVIMNGKSLNGTEVVLNSTAVVHVSNADSLTFNYVKFLDNYAEVNYATVCIEGNLARPTYFIHCDFGNNTALTSRVGIYYTANQPLIVTACNFKSNRALGIGGGAIYTKGSLNVTDSNFIENYALFLGGAIESDGQYLNIDNCTFKSNSAGWYCGGAVYAMGTVSVKNSIFIENSANFGGAIFSRNLIDIDNCTFKSNHADDTEGGVIYGVNVAVCNSLFIGNHADYSEGGAIFAEDRVDVQNSIFSANRAGRGGAICTNGSLNVADSSFIQNNAENGGGAIGSRGQYLNVNNCTFNYNNADHGNGGAILAGYSHVNFTVADSTFIDNSADKTGGAIESHGSLDVNNCTFKYNKVNYEGGAINTADNLSIRSSRFSDNRAEYGGAISSPCTVSIDSSSFSDNFAYCGGAVYCEYNLNVSDSAFTDNKAINGGGAIYSTNKVDVKNSVFENNALSGIFVEKYAGGAIYASTVSIDASGFSNNHADNDGGAVYAVNYAEISDSTFKGNDALSRGGAVYSENIVTLKDSTFENNRARDGGAVKSCHDVKIDNSTFSNNQADNDGGAVHADTVTWTDSPSSFTSNHAENNGGAIYTNEFTNNVQYEVFTNNSAKSNGGAIYIKDKNDATFSQCTFKDNRAGDKGGAIYLDDKESVLSLNQYNSFVDNAADVEGQNVFNNGTYKTVRNNWWGTPFPDFSKDLLVEGKTGSSNVNCSDESPLLQPPTGMPTVIAHDLVKMFKNGSHYYATFLDAKHNILANKEVSFIINGVTYKRITDKNGIARLNIWTGPGKYPIKALNPVTGEAAYNNITVLSNIAEANDLTKYYKNTSQYVVTIIDSNGNPVNAGENVTFNINGVFYTRTTNATGQVKLNINLQPGDYIITAEYGGCKASNNIKVLPVLSGEDLTKRYMSSDPFVATLLDGQGNPAAGKTVTFNINGVFYHKVTDSQGHAALNIRLMPGKYIITSTYNGTNVANTVTVTL